MRYLIFLVPLLLLATAGHAQSGFYALDTIQKIEIQFNQADWDYEMDTAKAGAEGYTMAALVKVNGVAFDSVGVKYKGNSTYSATRVKNPLHIRLNKYKDQDYNGVDDIKLSNGFADPSMIREALSYDVLRHYMHCSRANFAQVYINGAYIGLYTNDEDVSKGFCKDHFLSNKKNAFIKCNPPGSASTTNRPNLKYLGADSALYQSRYQLESDTGWNDLVRLCDAVSNTPDSAGNAVDMDRAIWMLAFDNVTVNLDSYLGTFVQNYYLFKDNTGHYNPVVWDLNQCFGSFNSVGTDAGGMGGPPNALDQLSITTHGADSQWPLISAILNNARWKKMYVAHLRTMLSEQFGSNDYKTRATLMQGIIDTAVQSDANKFYTYAQFQDGMTATASGGGPGGGGPGSMVPEGIGSLMDARVSYLQSTTEFQQVPPTIVQVAAGAMAPATGSTVSITAAVSNTTGGGVFLGYRFDSSLKFTRIPMYDDGAHADGAANDGVFGVSIPVASQSGMYYVYAENADAGAFAPARAEHEFYSLLAQPAAVTTVAAAPTIRVHPNPADGPLWLSAGSAQALSYAISNSLGQVMISGTLQGEAVLNTAAWPAGVYFVRAGNGAVVKVCISH